MENRILERIYLQGVLRTHNTPYVEDVSTDHLECGCMGYAPIVNGRRTLPFSWRPRDKLREVVTLGRHKYPGTVLDGRRTVGPPTRITVTPRSGLYLPPSEDIWIEFHDDVCYPIQQFQFGINGFNWMVPQSLRVCAVVAYGDDPRLMWISGIVVVACFLIGIEDCNDFVHTRIREPAIPCGDLKWDPVSQNTRVPRQKPTYQRPRVRI